MMFVCEAATLLDIIMFDRINISNNYHKSFHIHTKVYTASRSYRCYYTWATWVVAHLRQEVTPANG